MYCLPYGQLVCTLFRNSYVMSYSSFNFVRVFAGKQNFSKFLVHHKRFSIFLGENISHQHCISRLLFAASSMKKTTLTDLTNFPQANSARLFSSVSADVKKLSEKKTHLEQKPVEKGYSQIYRFPWIVHVHTLCRVKILQTAIVVGAIPICALYAVDEIQSFLFVGGFTLFMLYLMGEVCRRFVGIVHYHPVKKRVCISHLNFWGKRVDSFYDLPDVVPLTDSETNLNDIYAVARIYSEPKRRFWISLRYGKVLNNELFEEVFGDIKLKY